MSFLDWFRVGREAVATVADLVELIDWVRGAAVSEPRILSKVPAATKSAAQRLRERSIASNEFNARVAKARQKAREQ